jgi:UDP-N-acetylmuramoyl-L-alanyl-D-glutamate--2,6-diaminopimelate ligase
MTPPLPPVLRPENPPQRSLADLVARFALPVVANAERVEGVAVTGITLSTADLRAGEVYVAIQGRNVHGASFAADAVEAGAVAIVTDAEGAALAAPAGLPVLEVPAPREVLGALSAWVYDTEAGAAGLPLLLGVTGTNGKTSTVHLLEGVLRALGRTPGLSSTAERHIGDLVITSRLTTPESSEMHALLARMREADVEVVALEVSAQALSRHRVDGILFDVVGFTNLSHDHLDDYVDFDEYMSAKVALFQPDRAGRGVVSLDSEWGPRMVDRAGIPVTTISATEGVDADWTVTFGAEMPSYTEFTLTGPAGESLTTRIPIIGRHMAADAGLALVLCVEAGIPFAELVAALDGAAIDAVLPGRTQRVSGDTGPTVYVDFGHSPDAFAKTLAAVRRVTPGRVLMLFGADGDRDATKRPDMAREAVLGSDILVVTDHHPRFEDPDSIRATLVAAAREARPDGEIHEVSPPERAIEFAVSLVGERDAILWAGPGHQDYRDIRGERTPYSARQLARDALAAAGWPPAEAPVVRARHA